MVTFDHNGAPQLTCVCGSIHHFTDTNICRDCKREFTTEDLLNFAEEVTFGVENMEWQFEERQYTAD